MPARRRASNSRLLGRSIPISSLRMPAQGYPPQPGPPPRSYPPYPGPPAHARRSPGYGAPPYIPSPGPVPAPYPPSRAAATPAVLLRADRAGDHPGSSLSGSSVSRSPRQRASVLRSRAPTPSHPPPREQRRRQRHRPREQRHPSRHRPRERQRRRAFSPSRSARRRSVATRSCRPAAWQTGRGPPGYPSDGPAGQAFYSAALPCVERAWQPLFERARMEYGTPKVMVPAGRSPRHLAERCRLRRQQPSIARPTRRSTCRSPDCQSHGPKVGR